MSDPEQASPTTDPAAVPQSADNPPPRFDAPTPPAPEVDDPPDRNAG